MTKPQRHLLVQVLDSFSTPWSKDNLKELLLLGFTKLDDIEKLCGYYFAMKEDPSVFVTPAFNEASNKASQSKQRQWTMDKDYVGFSFAPKQLLGPYTSDKLEHPKQPGELWP